MFVNHVHITPRECQEHDATLDTFLSLADKLGVEGAVCFAPSISQFKFCSRTDNPNVWLARTLADRPNLFGYGSLDPGKPAAPQVKQIAELGFRGIKLHPPGQKFYIFGEWAKEAYAAMEEHRLTADFHMGVHWHRLSDTDPLLCDEIAWHFPKLRMVFEHVGGWHYYRQMLAVITNNAHRGNHLYAGIASVFDRDPQSVQHIWYLGPEGLEDCRWQIGPDLLIYGLDFPYNTLAQNQHDLEIIRALPWPAKDISALLGGNLRRLLGLDAGSAQRVGGDPPIKPDKDSTKSTDI